MGGIDLRLYFCPRLCRLGLLTALVAVSSLWNFSGQFLTSCCHCLHPPPAHSLATLAQSCCTPPKNDLKWPKIKQVTTSKLYYNKLNRLISPVLQNKVDLRRAKAGYTN